MSVVVVIILVLFVVPLISALVATWAAKDFPSHWPPDWFDE